MTASSEAMFTATPVTVPARCLPGRNPSVSTNSWALALPPAPNLFLPVFLVALNPLPGLVHLDVLIAVAGDAEDAAQGIANSGGGRAERG